MEKCWGKLQIVGVCLTIIYFEHENIAQH